MMIMCKVRELAEKESENGVFRLLRSDVTRFLTTILIGTTYFPFIDLIIEKYCFFNLIVVSHVRLFCCTQRGQYWGNCSRHRSCNCNIWRSWCQCGYRSYDCMFWFSCLNVEKSTISWTSCLNGLCIDLIIQNSDPLGHLIIIHFRSLNLSVYVLLFKFANSWCGANKHLAWKSC